jgi:hypothetical protein
MWMNEYEIDEALDQFEYDTVLSSACVTLSNLRDAVNANSDGWPYWQAPAKAASKLMTLIQEAQRQERNGARHQLTSDQVAKAMVPIKSFRTRQGLAFDVVAP